MAASIMPKQRSTKQELGPNMLAASSCIAAAVVAFNPLDCWRIRWQVQSQHTSMQGHVRSILRSEGLVRGLWLPGVGANAAGAGMSRGVGMGAYPMVRDAIVGPDGRKGGGSMFAAGLLSGGLGYGLSTPFWVVKTRLQAGLESRPLYRHTADGLARVVREEGARALWRGGSALVVRGALMNSKWPSAVATRRLCLVERRAVAASN